MKTKPVISLIALFFFLILIFPTRAHSQGVVSIQHAGDTTWSGGYCQIPDSVLFLLYGSASGYLPGDTIQLFVNFGDGQDTIIREPLFQNQFYFYFEHLYTSRGFFSVQYIVTGPDGSADTLVNINELYIADTCGNVRGQVYADLNGNCQYEAGLDTLLVHFPVHLYSGTSLIDIQFTDAQGMYYFTTPPGTFTVDVNTVNSLSPTCPTSGQVNVVTSVNPVNDFGLNCANALDWVAHGSGWGYRPGNTGYLYPSYQNLSCLPASGTMSLTLDPRTNYVSSTLTPDNISGNVLTWNLSNVSIFSVAPQLPMVSFTTSLSANIGDTLCFTVDINPLTGDANPSNNSFTFCGPVRNSWDPNMKEVFPLGIGSEGRIPANTSLDYVIHFQNCGNDTAYNVAILDTLDSNLDLQTLFITGSDHNVIPNYQGNGIIKFNFPNIYLVDSMTNPILSQGWVSYSIRTLPGLAPLTQIRNTAYIFFDYNYPIITNTSLNTIDYNINRDGFLPSGYLKLYPNPASERVEIQNLMNTITYCNVRILDISGKVVHVESFTQLPASVSTAHLPSGFYQIELKTREGVSIEKLILRH